MAKDQKNKGLDKDAALAAALELPVETVITETPDETEVELEVDEQEVVENEETVTEHTEQEVVEQPTIESPVVTDSGLLHQDGTMTDAKGTPIFKRMAPTIADPGPVKKERQKASYKPVTKQKRHEVSANSALITFPNDRYGITKDLKVAFIRAASRVAGDANKKAIVDEVVEILKLHLDAKFKADKEYRARLEKQDEQQ